MRASVPLGGIAWGWLVLAWAGAARAEHLDETFETPAPERRHGFSIGLAGGLSAVSARGFPNEAEKVGVAEYESSTGLSLATGGGFWVGGAITDWLTLAIGVLGGSASGNGLEGSGGGFLVRVETFPLYLQGGAWRDLGLAASFGMGGMSFERDGETAIEGQATSAIALSAFHESVRFWQLAMGPQLDYGYQFSDSATAHQLVLGWRTAFYAGP